MPTRLVDLDDDLALAHRLADAAAATSMSYFGRSIERWSKADGSLATEADIATERAVRALIASSRPGDAVLGEEEGETGSGSRRWIVDGIDGTVDFAAGSPDWGTLLALEVDGQIVVSVCDQPAHRQRSWATRGHGAFRIVGAGEKRQLHVTGVSALAQARAYIPPLKWLPNDRARAVADAVAKATSRAPEVDHPALQVATGGYDLTVFMTSGPWDLAAPALIVEEAGGRFSDLSGAHRFTSHNAIFSNGRLHDEVVRLIASIEGRRTTL